MISFYYSIYTCLGHPFNYGKAEFSKELVETDRKWMLQFTNGDQGLFYHLLNNKLISGNRIKPLDGGLGGVIEGLKLLEEGKVSHSQLHLIHTPHRSKSLSHTPRFLERK